MNEKRVAELKGIIAHSSEDWDIVADRDPDGYEFLHMAVLSRDNSWTIEFDPELAEWRIYNYCAVGSLEIGQPVEITAAIIDSMIKISEEYYGEN